MLASRAAPPLIVHVLHHLHMGGMENGLVNLINGLPEDAFRHAVLCVEDFSDFRLRIRRPDVPVLALRRSAVGVWAMRRALFAQLRTWRPAIVHSRNTSGLDALLPAYLAGVPVRIHSEHGWDVDDLNGQRARPRWLRRAHAPLVSHYVTVSEDLARYLTQEVGIARQRISTICNGVDTTRFAPRETPDLSWLPESFRAPGLIRIGTVGRLQAVKDQDVLICAFAVLRSVLPAELSARLRLVLVGSGPLQAALAARIQERDLQTVCWMAGAREDVPRVLSSLDLFVLPSLNEGISNTLLEAMACGVPVLASRVGGNRELIVPGVGGDLFPAQSEAQLVQLLADWVTQCADPVRAAQHRTAARSRALSHYSVQGMLHAYAQLYRRFS